MGFIIRRTASVVLLMTELQAKDERKYRKIRKTLGQLAQDPRHPGLHSHKRYAEKGPNGEDIWQSYVENNVPSAWRVFWYYSVEPDTIIVFAITPHP